MLSFLYLSISQAATVTDGPGKKQGDIAYLFDIREFNDQLYEFDKDNFEVLVGVVIHFYWSMGFLMSLVFL